VSFGSVGWDSATIGRRRVGKHPRPDYQDIGKWNGCGANVKKRNMYVEAKTGYSDDGPAKIGRVSFFKTGRTIYYQGKSFQRIKGGGVWGNYFDVETGDEYWISGVKKNHHDRLITDYSKVEIDDA
jgi:hypothetical protein